MAAEFHCPSCQPSHLKSFHYACIIKHAGTRTEPSQWQCTHCQEDQLEPYISEKEPLEQQGIGRDVNAAATESLVETEARTQHSLETSNHIFQSKRRSASPKVNAEKGSELAKSDEDPSPLKDRCVCINGPVSCADQFSSPDRKPETWSVSDVAAFIRATGFEKEAGIFREQEIDGKSLLLMKRGDVITGLNLPLGVALKLYSFINHLQIFKLVSMADCPQ